MSRASLTVYIWADGVYLQARMEVEKQCILVIIIDRRSALSATVSSSLILVQNQQFEFVTVPPV